MRVILRTWLTPASPTAVSRASGSPPAASTIPPMSFAGSAPCRRRTTASRCGRSDARVEHATAERVEQAIADRQIVRTWLMRGTIHFAAAEDVRWLLALCSPRLLAADERRCAQIGLETADIERSAELLRDALAGDRRLSRPEVMRLARGRGHRDRARPRLPHSLPPFPGGPRLSRADAGQAADRRPARRLGSSCARARALAGGVAGCRCGALRGQSRARDRAGSRALGGDHRGRCAEGPAGRRRPDLAHVELERVLALGRGRRRAAT